MNKHLDSLKQKHSQLDNDIRDEMARPQPNDIHIKSLKQEKLKLKEEIEKLQLTS